MLESKFNGLGTLAWASAGILAAFVSSTYLAPQAFEPLRPPERERGAITPLVPEEINARLWEDPLAAVKRHEDLRLAQCTKMRSATGKSTCDAGAPPAAASKQSLPSDLTCADGGDCSDQLVAFVLVPGGDFVGAGETRRRTRYAVLSGLTAQGYVPDASESMKVLRWSPGGALQRASPVATAPAAAPPPPELPKVLPYEVLTQRRLGRVGAEPVAARLQRYQQVAVVWVDEELLPKPKFDQLARLAHLLVKEGAESQCLPAGIVGARRTAPAVAVFGPSSTDALRTAITDLREAASRSAQAAPQVTGAAPCALPAPRADDTVASGYRVLGSASFYITNSTAPHSMLEELHEQRLENFVDDQFKQLAGPASVPAAGPRVVRTIGTDNDVIRRLVAELQLRLPAQADRRIVVFAERDSLYSQALVLELKRRLADEKRLQFQVEYFLRGVDGATSHDAADKPVRAPPGGSASDVEWPESRDQLDYLRRVGQTLRDSQTAPGAVPIGAIGIFASEVHDKLLVLQALRDDFSDKTFFTTDFDARFMHPRTQPFTRNLVVVSSLPLAFHAAPAASGIDLRAGTPPLRDAYQTASYLAARLASCSTPACHSTERATMDAVLRAPSVYEIGRSRAVALSGYAADAPRRGAGMLNLAAALAVAVLAVVALLVWPSTHSMRRARALMRGDRSTTDDAELDLSSIVLTVLQVGVLSFVLASLIEFLWPQQVSFVQMLLLASLGGLIAMLAVLPSLLARAVPAVHAVPDGHQPAPFAPSLRPAPAEQDRAGSAPALDPLHACALALLCGVWVWLAWPSGGPAACRECEPVEWFQGVSAWPSHLLHLLALVGTVIALDQAWIGLAKAWRREGRHPRRSPRGVMRAPWLRHRGLAYRLWYWRRHYSLLFWRGPRAHSFNAARLWREYCVRSHPRARAARVLLSFVVSVALGLLVFVGVSEGQLPEVPVRGAEHRLMVKATLYALLLLLPLLVMVVVDATLLLLRFISHLNTGRSSYTDPQLAGYADALGDAHRLLWIRRLAARPAERDGAQGLHAPRVHTLLDPWIDLQLIARLSQPVVRLVIWPFVVVAVIVVARSRLFDNWSLTPPIAGLVAVYVAVLVGLALGVKQGAEQARRKALKTMRADLRWLTGSTNELAVLAAPLERLIQEAEQLRTGAFAPFMEQPLLKALLVPLGGAGGTQLFDAWLGR